MTTESPDWLAVYIEITRRLRANPELMKECQQRGGEDVGRRAKERLEEWHATGGFRDDVSLEDIVVFINVVANGAALATALGLPLNADALVKLVHGGIDPQ